MQRFRLGARLARLASATAAASSACAVYSACESSERESKPSSDSECDPKASSNSVSGSKPSSRLFDLVQSNPTVQLTSLPAADELGRESRHFSVYTGTGEPASLADVLRAAQGAEVVLLGETHDDVVAHQLELYMLMSLQQHRATALSLEMFETDVQPVLDEYLAGLIRETDMMMDARPWMNYNTDYRPMVEFAKHARLPVAAANAPRRFVGATGRRGPGALAEAWPSRAAGWLPPLPLPQPSLGYLTHLFHDAAFLSEASREQLGFSLNAVGGGAKSSVATPGTTAQDSGMHLAFTR